MNKKEINMMITKAIQGDDKALEALLVEVQDFVYNLSLRMLGTLTDCEDATQDILIKIMTNLSSFRKDSNYQTWVYRIAVNYLIDYRKSMFAKRPLNFDFYGNDIRYGHSDNEELLLGLDREQLAGELKMSCSNVMLQCLEPETRCIFIVGTMFKIDSKVAGEIFEISPENYRKKLSRARSKMAKFLSEYCGLGGGMCSCIERVSYAIEQHRLDPKNLEYSKLKQLDHEVLENCKIDMEYIDELSESFMSLPNYKTSIESKEIIKNLLNSKEISQIKNY
ncbi:MAG: RNA polymerase sigma factor [Thomasclavelia sp.]|uniref:RNA polymerase sigma factor n=1 Tax=Thomasclavelia sp. TaxID=3025757 RepID=UPI0039A1D61E